MCNVQKDKIFTYSILFDLAEEDYVADEDFADEEAEEVQNHNVDEGRVETLKVEDDPLRQTQERIQNEMQNGDVQ